MVTSTADDWILLSDERLAVAEAYQWAVQPSCGGVVIFVGTVRDHSEGREGITGLEYEAYAEQVEPKLRKVAVAARRRWPELGRLAMHHRTGRMRVTEASVVVAASAPHRTEAFDAARYCIDTLKATVPIWKREIWDGGSAWAACNHEIVELQDVTST